MNPRAKSALLWGAVGFLTFAVLAQGSTVVGERLLTLPQAAVGAALAGGVVAAIAYRYERRVAAWAADRRT